MKKRFVKKIITAILSVSVAMQGMVFSPLSTLPIMNLVSYADTGSGFVNTERLNVRSGPGTSYDKVISLGAGTQVSILGETTGSDGYQWYNISFGSGSGYARFDFISKNVTYATASADFEDWMNNQGFPESYKNGLRGLHQQYPNWVFKAFQTGLDWNTVIAEESRIGRNLVDKNSISSWKSVADGAFDWAGNFWPGFDGATWVQASTELIAYYMDPRNFLTDPYVFQFEHQTYNPAVQTKEGLQNLISGTFLAGDAVVPVDGSQVEGGTIIEGSSFGSGNTGNSGTAGPGPSSGSSSGYAVIGSGGVVTSSGSGSASSSDGYTVIGPGGVSSGSSETFGPSPEEGDGIVSLTGPGMPVSDAGSCHYDPAKNSLAAILDRAAGVLTSYAAKWRQEQDPVVRWVYVNDDGSYLTDGWYWLDGNGDGISECYYFYSDGTMASDTEVDGWRVNADGQWIHGNGEPYTKGTRTEVSSGTASGTSDFNTAGSHTTGQLKKVPYADIIMKAAEASNVSPYVLAAAILQEQGKGTSDLISGTNAKYPGYYNYYNTGAYAHDGMSAVEAGLKYASESGNGGRPWNTIEKAIIGGASAYGASYVAQGQDTFYLKKYNVQGKNKFNHQFMTHVLGAASEGAKVSKAYSDSVKAGALEFSIPVYQNMPDSTVLPAGDGNPNNKLSFLGVDGYTITPTFSMDTAEYSLIVDGGSTYVNISAQAIDSGAVISGAGNVALNTGSNDIIINVRAANGNERNYRINITRREGGSAGQAAAPSPMINGNTDSNGATWVNNGGDANAAGPGVIISSGDGNTSEGNGYAVIGPGGSAGQAVIQNSTAGNSDNSGAVLIGEGPQ